MNFHIGFSDVIATVALFLSALSIAVTIIFSKRQDKLTRLLIAKEEDTALLQKQADISAEIVKEAGDIHHHRLKVSNSGKATATNVRLQLPGELDHLVVYADSLIPALEPNQSLGFPVIKAMNSQRSLTIKFTWDDPSGRDREKDLTILV
ncbi:MAG: hypothetical protein WAN65_27600 [Candidatus Sulfotelmatobacter sp.]